MSFAIPVNMDIPTVINVNDAPEQPIEKPVGVAISRAHNRIPDGHRGKWP